MAPFGSPRVPSPLDALLRRRDALKIGGPGFLGLNALHHLRASDEIARAKSVIFLYQFGGPTHLDTFDMKPDAPEGYRGPLGSIESSLPGLRICELLPETAKIMHKVTLLRSVHHSMKNHNSASYCALTGHLPPVDDIRLKDTSAAPFDKCGTGECPSAAPHLSKCGDRDRWSRRSTARLPPPSRTTEGVKRIRPFRTSGRVAVPGGGVGPKM